MEGRCFIIRGRKRVGWQVEGDLRWGIGSHFAVSLHGIATAFQSNAGLQAFTYW